MIITLSFDELLTIMGDSCDLSKLTTRLTKLETQMASIQSVAAEWGKRLDGVTSQFAQDFRDLRAQMGNRFTAEEKAMLDGKITALEAMGKENDPNNPVPMEPPAPTPTPAPTPAPVV